MDNAGIPLVLGCDGQDGILLVRQLARLGANVIFGVSRSHNATRSTVSIRPKNFRHIAADLSKPGEATMAIIRGLDGAEPTAIYHLAARSRVGESFDQPQAVIDNNIGCTLTAIELADNYRAALFHTASSEMFGGCEPGQVLHENSPMRPRSPYAVSKLASYELVRQARVRHRIWAANGILFNHESEFRDPYFVTMKIARHAAQVRAGANPPPLRLGNIESVRDWGDANDAVAAMIHIMGMRNHGAEAGDWVVATGKARSVADLIAMAGIADHCKPNCPDMMRPWDVLRLVGDAYKLKATGWEPKIPFEDTMARMIADWKLP